MSEQPWVIEMNGGVRVGPGEVVGVCGPGAQDVLALACGDRAGTPGAVRVRGADPYRERSRVLVGALWADDGLYGGLALREIAGAWRSWAPRRFGQDALSVIALLGRRQSVPYDGLAPGERRLFDLAVVLLAEPDALVVEEPATGLDGAEAGMVWAALRGLRLPVLVGARHPDGVLDADRIIRSAPFLLAA